MADLNKLAEDIVGLTLLQAQELKTILKDKYGLTTTELLLLMIFAQMLNLKQLLMKYITEKISWKI